MQTTQEGDAVETIKPHGESVGLGEIDDACD
jgi:hypothetical protein